MVRANELTATHALRLMRTGDLSVEALAQACLERVRERDAAVRGWAHLDPELVLRNARELDRRGVKGPLHGIPIAVKDVILTEDMPTEYNSPLYKGSFPAVDAGCVPHLAGDLLDEFAQYEDRHRQALRDIDEDQGRQRVVQAGRPHHVEDRDGAEHPGLPEDQQPAPLVNIGRGSGE